MLRNAYLNGIYWGISFAPIFSEHSPWLTTAHNWLVKTTWANLMLEVNEKWPAKSRYKVHINIIGQNIQNITTTKCLENVHYLRLSADQCQLTSFIKNRTRELHWRVSWGSKSSNSSVAQKYKFPFQGLHTYYIPCQFWITCSWNILCLFYCEFKSFALQMLWKMTFMGNQATSQNLPLKAIPNSSLGESCVAAGL